MSLRRAPFALLLCALTALFGATAPRAASARVAAAKQSGPLPGFPAVRGVVPVLGSEAAIARRAALLARAEAQSLRAAAARLLAPAPALVVPGEEKPAPCWSEAEEALMLSTHDICSRGGPVLRDPTLHVIYWQGGVEGSAPKNEKVSLFPPAYREIVDGYLEAVAADSLRGSNVFAVDQQYFGVEGGHEKRSSGRIEGGTRAPGEYRSAFGAKVDALLDIEHEFPSHSAPECEDKGRYSEGPCLLDSDIRTEVEAAVKSSQGEADHWSLGGAGGIYLVLTPPGVGGCFAKGRCAYSYYCAYHGDFGGDGMTPGQQTIYADLPYIGNVSGCDSGTHPNEKTVEAGKPDGGADALIDTASHELNEAITDPIGSQCDESETTERKVIGCEPHSWVDATGLEIADKCLPPAATSKGFGDVYGEPLQPGLGVLSYNQSIAGHHYWTQRVWSNEAGSSEGACVQRVISAQIGFPSAAAAGTPARFEAAGSGAEGDPADYYVWSFGDGEQLGSASATITHTYAQAGSYEVGLTAYDAFGSSRGAVGHLSVGPAQATSTTSSSTTGTVTTTVRSRPSKFNAAALQRLLKLPKSGRSLAGLTTIALGNAECPPACTLVGHLYTGVSERRHHRRVTRNLLIGRLYLHLHEGDAHALMLKLDAPGRDMLRRAGHLAVQLQLAVIDAEGGGWQLSTSYELLARGAKR